MAAAAGLTLAVLLVHGRDVAFGFTSLDDRTLLIDDRAFLTSPGAMWRAFGRTYFRIVDAAHAYYRPVVTASYALDARAFGVWPCGYHAVNLIIHLVATWLVCAVLLRTRVARQVAIWGAAVFAVHPALVQAVAWIPGRNDMLVTAFLRRC